MEIAGEDVEEGDHAQYLQHLVAHE